MQTDGALDRRKDKRSDGGNESWLQPSCRWVTLRLQVGKASRRVTSHVASKQASRQAGRQAGKLSL